MSIANVVLKVLVTALCATGMSAVAQAQMQPAKGEPVVIGVHLDTGKQASYYSLLQRDSMALFVKVLNREGGIKGRPVELAVEDDENNPVTASTKVEKFESRGALYVISIGSSATGVGAQAKAQPLKIPHGSPGNMATSLTKPIKSYYFRLAMSFDVGNEALVEFVKRKSSGQPRVAVVRDTTETGYLLSDSLIKRMKDDSAISVVAVEQVTPGSTDVTSQAVRVKGANPNFVILAGGSVTDLANYAKMHRTVGNNAQMLGTYLFATPGFVKLAGPAAEGFIYTDTVDPDRPEVKKIESILLAEGGDNFRNSPLTIQAWEYIRLVTDAMKRAPKLDRESIRDAMEATKDWPTALGPAGTVVNFSPTNHDLFVSSKQVVMREMRNGDFGPAVK
jgi:branched-chain amino acid transport system substrate-binding protein